MVTLGIGLFITTSQGWGAKAVPESVSPEPRSYVQENDKFSSEKDGVYQTVSGTYLTLSERKKVQPTEETKKDVVDLINKIRLLKHKGALAYLVLTGRDDLTQDQISEIIAAIKAEKLKLYTLCLINCAQLEYLNPTDLGELTSLVLTGCSKFKGFKDEKMNEADINFASRCPKLKSLELGKCKLLDTIPHEDHRVGGILGLGKSLLELHPITQNLPGTLETLRLNDWETITNDDVEAICLNAKLKNLKTVTFQDAKKVKWKNPQDFEKLKEHKWFQGTASGDLLPFLERGPIKK